MKKDILARLTNTKVIISIASTIVMILIAAGLEIQDDRVMIIVEGICTIGILLGVFNKDGMETKKWDDKS